MFLITAFCFVPSYATGTRSGKSFSRKTRSGKVYSEIQQIPAKPAVVVAETITPVDPADAVLPLPVIVPPVVVWPVNNEEPGLATNPILVDSLGTQENPIVVPNNVETTTPKVVQQSLKLRLLTGFKNLLSGNFSSLIGQ